MIDVAVRDKEAKAMTRSPRQIGRTRTIAKALAMIADAFPETRPTRESDEWLWQTATDFWVVVQFD
jgi:hypothetical protein